jgi:DNA-binding response OmpR family regulator
MACCFNAMRIAVVDDDKEITRYLAAALPEKGLLVEAFGNGAALKAAMRRDTFDAVVIDWNMPGGSGIEIVRWATTALADPPPFLVMTSRSDEADIVAGLEAGAIDYIVKPVTISILCARIAAAVRERSRTVQQAVVKFDGYTIERSIQSIQLHRQTIKLTPKEFQLAALLFDNLDRPLSRSYLLAQVWSAAPGMETRTLDVHISRIREKLKLGPENLYVLQTVFGFGYRLSRYVDDQE